MVIQQNLIICYKYQLHINNIKKNYKESLELDLIPAGLKIKKLPAITPVTPTFYSERNEVLRKAEKELVNLLLIESSKVVQKTERDVEEKIRIQYPTDYDRKRLKNNITVIKRS